MEEKEYKYDAFISYRHCDLDKFVAENLHKALETYELPKNLKEQLNIEGRTFKRLFRDQEELPLSSNLEDPILEALQSSKYLIVICSPRLKDSLWCKKEIETFKKLRGRQNIFCVLIEGEPKDSFPEEVVFDEIEVVKNGKKKTEKKPVEPLAADVRGETKKDVLKRIHEEKLRLAAAMCHIDYDDLRQRHKLREQKRKANIAMGISIASIVFLLYTSIMLIKINSQQNILKKHQALTLASKAEEYISNDNRYDAIKTSYESLTKFDGVKMPYTPEGESALVESLGVYDVGSSYKVVSELKTDGVATLIKSSDNNKYVAVYDESDKITLFNSKNLKVINQFYASSYTTNASFTFIGNDIFAYTTKDGDIDLMNIKNNTLVRKIKKTNNSYISVRGDSTGKYLVYTTDNTLYIYNVKDNKEIGTFITNDKIIKEIYYSEDSNYVFVGTKPENYDINVDDVTTIHVLETNTANEINNVVITAGYIQGMFTKDNNLYMLLNRSLGANYTATVVSYDYLNGYTNFIKTFEGKWGKYITHSFAEDTNAIAVASYDNVYVLDANTGDAIHVFNTSTEIINLYAFINTDTYLVILKDGSVNYLSMESRNSIELLGKYEFNLSEYSKVITSENGFLLIPTNENRVILYEEKSNKNIKEENIEIPYSTDNSVKYTDYDKLKDTYKMKNKSLIDKMLYSNDKELLFVNYTNNDLAIYDVKTKKLLNTITNLGKVDTYYGKDKNNRIYIGDTTNSYILDKNYNKVGHIKGLRKLDNDKVIISNNGKFYSVKIYNLNELLKEAKEYLK